MSNSRIADFYRKSIAERIEALVARKLIDASDASALLDDGRLLTPELADKMIENVIGVFGLPFATAPNFRVNDRDYIVPMVVEEPSVVAGVSSAAKTARLAVFAELLAEFHRFVDVLRQFDVDHDLGIFDAGHRELADAAAERNVVYKPCGAGGGDTGIVFATDKQAIANFTDFAGEGGFQLLDVSLEQRGVLFEN